MTHDPIVGLKHSELKYLRTKYLATLSGMRDLGATLVDEWGHDPAEHPQMLLELEVALSGALVETAADVMREHGLRDLRVEPVTAEAAQR